jgi:hypothetical protein
MPVAQIIEDPVLTGPKLLYKVEFWEENHEHELIAVRHLRAHTRDQARRALRYRAVEEARLGKYLLTTLVNRDDILMTITQVEDTRSQAKKEREGLVSLHTCQDCGETLDDDYCQSCGWRKQSWIDRAMEKQGKSKTDGE